MNTRQLEQTFNESEIVLCRSGYTTIMDIAKLDKKAFFIPTPGQYEQEYLAEKLEQEGIAPFATQDKVELKDIFKTQQYKGFSEIKNTINWANLFDVFEK
jgi:UDP-N-acetylglucosamine:LPS N-acetylglucosamine transferase